MPGVVEKLSEKSWEKLDIGSPLLYIILGIS